jgi:murein DD-endopeptidase MepM/ murein hydrolase activator NlpD
MAKVNRMKEVLVKRPLNLLLLSVFLLTALAAGDALAGYNEDLQTVYHVYVDGEKIGTVNDTSLIDELVREKTLEIQNQFPNYEMVVKEDLVLVPEKVFASEYNNEQAIAKLNHKISLAVKATALVVNNEIIGYVDNEEIGHELITNMLKEFAPAEIVEKLDNLEYENTNEIVSKLNDPTIIDVTLSEKVSLLEDRTSPSEILSADEAIELLKKGTLTDQIHTVKSGEVLGVIAEKYNLSVEEVLALNPGINPNTIQIGQELIVTDYEPYVKVTVTEAVTMDENIPFDQEVEYDDSMFKGTSKVKQYGQYGKKRIDYIITKENGKVIDEEIVNAEVIKQPVNKIVIRGTKVIPSRGTGEFAWPTYGGIITSYQGMRWGKYHKGIDISGVRNRNIMAIDNGTVKIAKDSGWNNGRGKYVVIDHNNGYESHYFHFSDVYVQPGQVVMKGQSIGYMGTTGRSTGVHLHIELYYYGSLLNPLDKLKR